MRLSHFSLLALAGAVLGLSACSRQPSAVLHGYVEGEYVRVAAPFAGQLTSLSVQRGTQVAAGAPLFALEQESEKAARLEAQARLNSAIAHLADVQKGRRPDEVASVNAQLAQAEAALRLSTAQYKRDEKLVADNFISRERLDQSRAARDRDAAHVAEIKAQLRVAKQGARSDEVSAARAEMQAAQAAVAQAQWRLEQKSVKAPLAGLVQDTLYTPGEWTPAGSPVVSLLPPANIKLRFFIPEAVRAHYLPGQKVIVSCDGCETATAHVSYVATDAEYTPPVIYSNDARSKLVYLAEARLDPKDAVRFHPGQPIDLRLP